MAVAANVWILKKLNMGGPEYRRIVEHFQESGPGRRFRCLLNIYENFIVSVVVSVTSRRFSYIVSYLGVWA